MREFGYKGWRYDLADIDRPESSAGLQISSTGAIATTGGAACVRQAIFLLLSTTPGERVMRPDYGCELKKLIFSPNDETTAGLAIHYVRRALERWEPRIELLDIEADSDPEAPNQLNITLEYRVRATGETDSLRYTLSLQGES